eukprot:NODE_626_length_5881_cov_0.289519.p6 type:complete len:100 gc:universal NODE_626_length_5881_cov_0.289519:4685-4386(-)
MICLWDKCNKEVLDPLSHLKVHLKDYQSQKCSWKGCKSVKKSKFKMMRHLLLHMNVSMFKCDCQMSFKSKLDLLKHQKCCEVAFNRIVHDLFIGIPVFQ